MAAGLAGRGIEPGHAVALMLPTSREFFVAFFGVLLAGGVPVPLYPPTRRSQLEDHMRRQSGILANSLAALLITVPEARGVARLLRASTRTLREIVSVADLDTADRLADRLHPRPSPQAVWPLASDPPRKAGLLPEAPGEKGVIHGDLVGETTGTW